MINWLESLITILVLFICFFTILIIKHYVNTHSKETYIYKYGEIATLPIFVIINVFLNYFIRNFSIKFNKFTSPT